MLEKAALPGSWTTVTPPPAFLARPALDPHGLPGDGQLQAGGRDQDRPGLELLAVRRMPHLEVGHAVEDRRKRARTGRADVEHDEDRRRKIGREVRHQLLQRRDPAGGGSDHDDVVRPYAVHLLSSWVPRDPSFEDTRFTVPKTDCGSGRP